tara:strand:+ start:98 stop:511 length:414 start_codon:yes stop_codon:yes gene_type:complete
MKIVKKIQNYLHNLLFLHPESKVFTFLFLVAYFFGLLKQVGTFVSISQGALLIVGLRSIKCMIEGNCYSDVYIFILVFTFTNIVLILYEDLFLKIFPKTTRGIIESKKKDGLYYKISTDIISDASKIADIDIDLDEN